MFRLKRTVLALLLGALFVVPCTGVASAQNVTQGYLSDQTLQNGMVVRLKPGEPTKIQALKYNEAKDMLGVVVANNDAPLSLSDPTKKQTFVAVFGKYDVLVSAQNGPIKDGDYITISSVEGVGMKAGTDQEVILGKAIGSFNGTNDIESKMTLTDSLGGKQDVGIKRILVDVSISRNPYYTGDSSTGVPQFLSKAAQLVTKKPVTALRIYACLAVLALSLAVAGAIIYSGVRTGMTAVGRNPLARSSIVRNLVTVTLMAMIIVIIGVVAVYLLLKI
jgi:hypothetical protein